VQHANRGRQRHAFGVDRSELILAWDFTTQSLESVTSEVSGLRRSNELMQQRGGVKKSAAGGAANRGQPPSTNEDGSTLTPLSRQALEQRRKLDSMLSASASMVATVNALWVANCG
jgi:hypothetical protein